MFLSFTLWLKPQIPTDGVHNKLPEQLVIEQLVVHSPSVCTLPGDINTVPLKDIPRKDHHHQDRDGDWSES